MRRALFLAAIVCLAVLTAKAQDPVKVDPKHYKVEFENAQVRVLRIYHDAHEKMPMHEHPAGVVIWLTDGREKETTADGKTLDVQGKAGQVSWIAPTKHAVENIGDKPFEIIFVELKAKPAAAKHAAKKPGT